MYRPATAIGTAPRAGSPRHGSRDEHAYTYLKHEDATSITIRLTIYSRSGSATDLSLQYTYDTTRRLLGAPNENCTHRRQFNLGYSFTDESQRQGSPTDYTSEPTLFSNFIFMLATRTRSGKPHRELGGHQTLATWQYSFAIYMLGRPVPPLRKATLSPSTTRIINENDQTANTRIPACLHRKGRASDRLIYKRVNEAIQQNIHDSGARTATTNEDAAAHM